jgi:hypothetical protein
MDCRYSLRDWTRLVGGLSGEADAAEDSSGQCSVDADFARFESRS